ncbi:MAG: ankyrin repeat domain-containing protein [Candidatus Micrarchaeota archaeon]|nr:ankyrin repeat domain-containing protein [Candidatus Micrarchaeota archaeon]
MDKTKARNQTVAPSRPSIAKQDILPPERIPDAIAIQEILNSRLFKAASAGKDNVIMSLLDEGADLNAKDSHGWTALSLAVFYCNAKTCEILISRGADVNTRDIIGDTPLHWAAFHGHISICKILVENGADLRAEGKSNELPHTVAMLRGHRLTSEFLKASYSDKLSKE